MGDALAGAGIVDADTPFQGVVLIGRGDAEFVRGGFQQAVQENLMVSKKRFCGKLPLQICRFLNCYQLIKLSDKETSTFHSGQ
ncbi:MAG: hypothetical protein QTN59_00245 [Candidatus Electrothrix communis]|nr:MAG: hypothetical protein QTN59_00245 [Candidatus Electrothrix communis]